MADKVFIAQQMNAAMRILAEQQTDEATMLMLADLYEAWQPGKAYTVDKVISYGTNAAGETQLYRVVQAHTSQAEWIPGQGTDSLYKAIGFTEEGYDIWTQPLGAHDAYQTGDIVSHNGQLWQSTCDGNVWEPGVYGWEQYTEPEEV